MNAPARRLVAAGPAAAGGAGPAEAGGAGQPAAGGVGQPADDGAARRGSDSAAHGGPQIGGGLSSGAQRPGLRAVAPPGPVARLGLVWAAGLIVATAVGPGATAVVVAPVAAVAAASGLRRTLPGVAAVPMAAAATAAVAATVVALAGDAAAAAAIVVLTAAATLVLPLPPVSRGGRPGGVSSLRWAAASVVLPALGAASLVRASAEAGVVAMGLAAAICLWDVSVYSLADGALGVGGAIAGSVSVGVLGVLFAAIAAPPLGGWWPAVAFGAVAAGAAVGVALCSRVAGTARLPALRRLDSAVVAGPAWVVVVRLALHH